MKRIKKSFHIIVVLAVILLYSSSIFLVNIKNVDAVDYAFVQAQFDSGASGFGHAFTSSNTAGNTIIVGAVWDSASTPTISDTLGNTYALAKMQTSAGVRSIGVWVAYNIAGGANTVTLTLAGQIFDATYLEYSGLMSTDQVAGASGTGGTPSSGNTSTTTQANEMVFGFGTHNASSIDAGSGFTSRASGVSNYYVRAEDKRVTSTGQYSADFGSVAAAWLAIAVTFKETPPDTTAPTVPTGLSATAVSASQINLTWNASTDAVGVTGYNIYRNTVLIDTAPSTSYSSTGLAASTQYTYTVSAFDATPNTSAQSSSAQATTQVAPPVGSAELPRVFIDTTYALPTGGTLWTPMNSADFQSALDSSSLGDVINLQAGFTYTGPFTLPNKSGSGWIYIRSSAFAELPAPGNRISPSQANLMPKIVGTGFPVIALQTAATAHNYRFVGIEFFPQSGLFATALIRLGAGSETSNSELPYNLVFDRTYIHGDPTIGGRRGIALNSNTTSIIDSYISDWKEDGSDSQAVAGWNGYGPYKIVNNYLEGAGENVMFGGENSTITNLVSADIEVRGNHFFKPFAWRNESWTIKNLFELKNAERIIIDGNIFENMWESAQSTAINLKASNPGTMPWAVQQDVTFTNNIIRHVSEGIKFCIKDCDGLSTQPGGRITVANNLFYDINSVTYGGTGRFINVIFNAIPDLVIDHNTVIHDGDTGIVDSTGPSSSPGFIFTNNITAYGTYGFKGSGVGEGNGTLAEFFPGGVFTKNILQGTPGGSVSNYPANNYYPATYANVGFVNQAGDDYHLASGSLYKNVGTDGADLGADISLIETRTSCVISGLCEGSAPLPDTTVPIVSITAPSDGATVSGSSVTISANASDDVAVVGVTFKVDGVTIGTEDTTLPYSVSWNSTTLSDGLKTVIAVVRDTSNNTTTSIPVAVTVNNTSASGVGTSGGGSGGSINVAVQTPSLINVTKIPTPSSLPSGPGSVKYNYTVLNVGTVSMSNVTVSDNSCAKIIFVSGDTNSNSMIDITETWKYSCTITLSQTTTNIAIATGTANGFTSVDTATATVVVGAPLIPPLIHLVKKPSVLILPVGGGKVTYSYTVTNSGTTPLSNVTITDNKCTGLPSRVAGHPGDLNKNNLLEKNETWSFTCQTNLTKTTTNTGTAKGTANGFTAVDLSSATVVVSTANIPTPPTPPTIPTDPLVNPPAPTEPTETETPSIPPTLTPPATSIPPVSSTDSIKSTDIAKVDGLVNSSLLIALVLLIFKIVLL